MTRVNGWRNGETWAVNLHWGDYFQSLSDDGCEVSPEALKYAVQEALDEALVKVPEGLRSFIGDMMGLSSVDWQELSDHLDKPETEKCEYCGEGKDAMAETETAWQCNDCEQWNEGAK